MQTATTASTKNTHIMKLQEKIAAITKEMGAIPKTKKEGSTVKYAFRGIDDVMNKLSPLLALHQVSLQSKILNHSFTSEWGKDKYGNDRKTSTALVHYQLIFTSGDETETYESIAMSEDFSDKAMTQAESMAYKYAILRKFCIMTEDTPDGDGRDPEPQKPQEPTRKQKDEVIKLLEKLPINQRGAGVAKINAANSMAELEEMKSKLLAL